MSDPYSTQGYEQPLLPAALYTPTMVEDFQAMAAPTSSFQTPLLPRTDSGYASTDASASEPIYAPQPFSQATATLYTTASYPSAPFATSAPLPLPPAASPGGAMPNAAALLQQHQANQHAFRAGQAAGGSIFQNLGRTGSALSGSTSGSGGDSSSSGGVPTPSSSASGSFANGSGGARPSGNGTNGQEADPNNGSGAGDRDFSQSFYDPFRVKHRRRTSPPQLKVLEHHFERNPKPDVGLRKSLAEQLDMTPREVQVWFQNRRAKVKKLKERAEREAAAAAAEAAHSGLPELPVPPPAFNALQAPPSELAPPPFPIAPPQHRAIYGHDALAARRGSSPAIFGGAPMGATFDNPFQPHPTAQPLQSLPPPALAAYPSNPAGAYPSPLSLGLQSATPSPNDLAAGSAELQPQHGGVAPALPRYFDQAASNGLASRRYSLPAHTMYNDTSALVQPMAMQASPAYVTIPQPPPPSSQLATSAPTNSSFFEQYAPAPLPHPVPAFDGLGVTSSAGTDPSLDGHSPASSYGDHQQQAPPLFWDGPQGPLPLDSYPPAPPGAPSSAGASSHPYAPQIPSALGRRASCPPDALVIPAHDAYGHHTLAASGPAPGVAPYHVTSQEPVGWAPEYAPPQLDGVDPNGASNPFYGYSIAHSTGASLAVGPGLVGAARPPYSRRGSLAAIAEQQQQHLVPNDGGASLHSSPPASDGPAWDQRERRGSVARTLRASAAYAHSPYAAAAAERHSPNESDEGLGVPPV
ncbi:hypothetical protein Rhopal_004259-T1 [Rhodotorula paludigena]|uniref:Homeobox domain-containing protein n=1 Tax=Rhodotorula paludigena TaxID=86838 RepID=A0AAV5GNX1_9BASI|nr:hypothetical protein Rhopal_004259-T1 [Rhodotorula paludigena]